MKPVLVTVSLPVKPNPLLKQVLPTMLDISSGDQQFRTRHLRRLIDDRGIIQHATGVVPLLSSGYCVDDIARLIPLALHWSETSREAELSDYWESVFVKAIAVLSDACERDSGRMRNFVSWTGEWIDHPYFGDHVGRALQGLSLVPDSGEYKIVVKPLVAAVLQHWPDASPLHPDAYALIAQSQAPHLANLSVARRMLDRVLGAFERHASTSWRWFEPTVRYDQGRLPHALLAGGQLLGDQRALDAGLMALAWLTQQCDQETYLRFPGHRGWAKGEPLQWSGDEQPLEALAFIEAHRCAYELTVDADHVASARRGLEWFQGANRLGQSLVNDHSGACCDGLGSFNVNENCGAESSLAWAHAHLQLSRMNSPAHPSTLPAIV
jgi:hypothetical protein